MDGIPAKFVCAQLRPVPQLFPSATSCRRPGPKLSRQQPDTIWCPGTGKHPKLAANAAGIVGQLMHATFPDDVVNNIDTSVGARPRLNRPLHISPDLCRCPPAPPSVPSRCLTRLDG